MTLLIDGHNLIGAMPGIDLTDPDDEWSVLVCMSGCDQLLAAAFNRASLSGHLIRGGATMSSTATT
jgi:hypothetical protein